VRDAWNGGIERLQEPPFHPRDKDRETDLIFIGFNKEENQAYM
jgi:hypothetical protein